MKPSAATLSVILALLAAPVLSPAQQPGKVYRIGCLRVSSLGHETDAHQCPTTGDARWQSFLEGLREHGYLLGQNLALIGDVVSQVDLLPDAVLLSHAARSGGPPPMPR